jgi:hypothetical protein
MIRDMEEADGLPDYRLALVEGDVVRVQARGRMEAAGGPVLDAEIHARLRVALPGWDPYFLEAEWRRHWQASGRPRLRSPEAALLAFARARAARTKG